MTASTAPPVAVVGAGGHAKVVVATIHAAGGTVAGVYDLEPNRPPVLGVPVLGPPETIPFDECLVILAIGDNTARQRVARTLADARWGTVIHPQASVHGSVTVGEGTVIFAGAVVQPDAVVGRHVVINTAATVDHDCRIADFVHVAPGAHLAGGVTVGEGALLGTGVATRQGVTIGTGTTVGVGAVVVRDLPPGVVAVGVPARAVRRSSHGG